MIKKTVCLFIFCIIYLFFLNHETFAESVEGVLPHKTDFLTLPDGPGGTTWYPTVSSSQRSTVRQTLLNKGYTHLYLSVASAEPGHNYYDGGATDREAFEAFLKELVDSGIKPVLWLTSDTGNWKNRSTMQINSDLTAFLTTPLTDGTKIDDWVNSYSMGIEINEYWSLDKANLIGKHLDTLTTKPIATHLTPWSSNQTNYCTEYCDYFIIQTNNPGVTITKNQIQNVIVEAINKIGKPVVAGEYNNFSEDTAIQLGNWALEKCAAGFGNGGTPANIIWGTSQCSSTPTIPPTSPTPTSSVNQPPIAQSAQYSTNSGQSVYIQLSFEDSDGPGPYTFSITQQPADGSLTGTDNDRTYTPNTGFVGTDTFKWKVNDGSDDSNIETVTITVGSSNPADANGDGNVNGLDFVVWLRNYGQNQSGKQFGDFNGNGNVGISDYVIWISNYLK